MRNRRSARRLPRYVVRKPLRGGWGYFFNLPDRLRKNDACPVGNEPLGTDYQAAVKRAEEILLPALDAWSGGGAPTAQPDTVAKAGTLDWVFAEYQNDRLFSKRQKDGKPISAKQQRNHKAGFGLIGGFLMADGRRLGSVHVKAITTAVVDNLYEKLLFVKTLDADGNTIERERRTTVNHAMKSCRRAWKVVSRRNPGKLPFVNPFAQMGLHSSDRETPTATFDELQIFRKQAVKTGLRSLGIGALMGWEWLQRVDDIFGTFDVSHYRPKDHPDAVLIVDDKTNQKHWLPLFDEAGVPLYPELMAELDAIKRERIGGLMLRRDWGTRGPWPTWPDPTRPDMIDLTHMSRKVKEVMQAAGLRDGLTFTSFRHGGATEGGDAELTDQELVAQGRWKSSKVLPRYTKKTERQVISGVRKRRASRTKAGNLSE